MDTTPTSTATGPKAADLQVPWDTFYANQHWQSASHEHECFLCGRGLTPKAVENGWWIHLLTDGHLTTRDDEAGDSQGCFPVGSECAKRIATPYKFRMREGAMA